MTRAVCIFCGEKKFGAFTECGRCGAEPHAPEELGHSLAYTDHYFDAAMLEKIGERIRRTGDYRFLDPAQAEVFTARFRPADAAGAGG